VLCTAQSTARQSTMWNAQQIEQRASLQAAGMTTMEATVRCLTVLEGWTEGQADAVLAPLRLLIKQQVCFQHLFYVHARKAYAVLDLLHVLAFDCLPWMCSSTDGFGGVQLLAMLVTCKLSVAGMLMPD
jgi:hypothetical protein